MTIVSHKYRLIFLRTRKTAGSSVEAALLPSLDRKDWISITRDVEPIDHAFFCTANATGRVPQERRVKRLIGKLGGPKPFVLGMHATAHEVRSVIGETMWRSYTKVSIERDPWDRFLSLYRWRTRETGTSLDAFLDAAESGDPVAQRAVGAEDWSNWPVYAIGDTVAADYVVQYDRLALELEAVLSELGVPLIGDLPRLKGGVRGSRHEVSGLTASHIRRIGDLYAREIEHFQYIAPTA